MRQLFRRITTISATCALAVSVAAAVAVAAEPTTGNILTGKLPTTNSAHLIGDGDTGFARPTATSLKSSPEKRTAARKTTDTPAGTTYTCNMISASRERYTPSTCTAMGMRTR